MMRWRSGLAILGMGSVVALLISIFSSTALAVATPAVIPMKWGPVGGDCAGQVRIGSGPGVLRYTIWCGVETGSVRFRVRGPKGESLVGFDHSVRAVGPGASGRFHCRESHGAVLCHGRAAGALTVRGTVTVSSAGLCKEHVRIDLGRGNYGGHPRGCPGDFRESFPSFGSIKGFRRNFGLDADIVGHPGAIKRRILGTIRAWRRGSPVARWTFAYVGIPMSAADQRLFDYHEYYINQFLDAIEPWERKHAASTYAGYDVDREHGGVIYLGFTADQDATIAAFKRDVHLIAPDQIKPFPIPPRYTERELEDLASAVVEPFGSELSKLVSSVEVDSTNNRVEVGTEHVRRVRELLAQKFVPEAPFDVVFEKPGTLL